MKVFRIVVISIASALVFLFLFLAVTNAYSYTFRDEEHGGGVWHHSVFVFYGYHPTHGLQTYSPRGKGQAFRGGGPGSGK